MIGPDGLSTLTKGPGGLFPHHRGIFIGWNRIQHGGKTHDLWHVRNTSQVHDRFIRTTADTQGGIVSSMVRWIGVDGEPILIEARTHRVLRDEDAYALIDFTSQLTASNGPVKLDGDPEHAGVQFRPSQQVAENKSATYTFHADGIDPRKDLDLPWVAVTFRLGDQAWTVQQMSHPDNPPGARWSAYRDYGRFGPFPVIEIPNGESRTLRYRFRITPGPAPPRTELAAAYEKYASP